MAAIISFRFSNEIYIRCHRDGSIMATGSVIETLDEITNGWDEYHMRDYQWSMSVCTYYIVFDIKVHEFDVNDLQLLIRDNILAVPFKIHGCHSVAGSMDGILCTGEHAKAWHESGYTPDLVKYEDREPNHDAKILLNTYKQVTDTLVEKGSKDNG